ncbi:hypothetical protein BDB00DRAFT_785014 [Zychaea mexicana]|uniref:uncharacterized protein n=1 Tax=Zychaea mexicana TaxID=64656 RepID=UPI0022FDEAA3|nr:uncharacterized protein BDB00DRAFT_785014 [Zychaea mexicana]KAI9497302.1 hypothetical protein BDB00DRAFT_785014 [Zychaea mexicana]
MEPSSYGILSPKPSNSRQLLMRLDAVENELGFLLGECATIHVMIHSRRNVFRISAPTQSRSADIQREILIDYDDLFFKVKQLERKLERLETELKATQQEQQLQQQWWLN